MKYTILTLLVYFVCSFIAVSLVPSDWHISVRITSVLLLFAGVYGIERGVR